MSVIVPTRNRVGVLAGVLGALLVQVREIGGEVVVVDDGSTDDTSTFLRTVADSGAPLRWARQEAAGPAAARNRGLALARGQVLFFTGDDMFPAPGLLAGHLHVHADGFRAAVVGTVAWDPGMRVSPLMRMMAPNGPLFNFRKAARSPERRYRFFYTANLSMRPETLGAERFDERFRAAAFEDTELGVRLERAGVSLVYRPDLIVYHRHALAAQDLVARLEALRAGRRVLTSVHPELAPGLGACLRDGAVVALVRAWNPLEQLLGLRPKVPDDWTNGHARC